MKVYGKIAHTIVTNVEFLQGIKKSNVTRQTAYCIFAQW